MQKDNVQKTTSPRSAEAIVRRVAVIDGIGDSATVDLYEEFSDGEINSLSWPKEWGNYVSPTFLRENGFEVIRA